MVTQIKQVFAFGVIGAVALTVAAPGTRADYAQDEARYREWKAEQERRRQEMREGRRNPRAEQRQEQREERSERSRPQPRREEPRRKACTFQPVKGGLPDAGMVLKLKRDVLIKSRDESSLALTIPFRKHGLIRCWIFNKDPLPGRRQISAGRMLKIEVAEGSIEASDRGRDDDDSIYSSYDEDDAGSMDFWIQDDRTVARVHCGASFPVNRRPKPRKHDSNDYRMWLEKDIPRVTPKEMAQAIRVAFDVFDSCPEEAWLPQQDDIAVEPESDPEA